MRVRKRLVVAIIVVVLSTAAACAQTAAAATATAVAPARVPPQAVAVKIRDHVRALTGDLAGGGGADAEGRKGAADYIARQFAQYGLRPAGDIGTYFQEVPVVGVETLRETAFTLVTPGLETLPLRNLEDFATNNERATESAYVDAPIVFVGYGIRAPEYEWDDYKQSDLSGKVALVLANEPASGDGKLLQGKAPRYYGSAAYKFEETARRGAIATLIVHPSEPVGDSWETVRNEWGRERFYLRTEAAPRLQAASWISSETARKLAAMAGADLETLLAQALSKEFRPIELPLRLQAHVASRLHGFVSRNVLAVLPGRGGLSEQAILYTAHCDPPDNADGIAASATACGMLLEVARAWSRTPSAPARTMLFAALSGAGDGLPGAEYLAGHSPVRPGDISLNLDVGALPLGGTLKQIEVRGAERTTFYSPVEATAKGLGLAIRPDPLREAGRYYASSPFALARLGIPAFSIAESSEPNTRDAASGDAEPSGRRATGAHPAAIGLAGAARLATFAFQLGVRAAAEPKTIGWLPGDEFEAERKRSQLRDPSTLKPLQERIKPKRRK